MWHGLLAAAKETQVHCPSLPRPVPRGQQAGPGLLCDPLSFTSRSGVQGVGPAAGRGVRSSLRPHAAAVLGCQASPSCQVAPSGRQVNANNFRKALGCWGNSCSAPHGVRVTVPRGGAGMLLELVRQGVGESCKRGGLWGGGGERLPPAPGKRVRKTLEGTLSS